ncbi:class I SAM-dependent methyltransferase [Streptomyces sp. NPDC004270]
MGERGRIGLRPQFAALAHRLRTAGRSGRRAGVNLTEGCVDVARRLTERMGFAERTRFQHGDVTALPFPQTSFDRAWMLHVDISSTASRRCSSSISELIRQRAGLYAGFSPRRSQSGAVCPEQDHQRAEVPCQVGQASHARFRRAECIRRHQPSIKIRTIPGPASRFPLRLRLFSLVNDLLAVYRQQTKNILCSYSPRKLGFF